MNFGKEKTLLIQSFEVTKQKRDPQVEHKWKTRDSDLASFARTFMTVLPDEYKKTKPNFEYWLKEYITDTLSVEKDKSLVAVEFGGQGSQLFSSFDNFFSKSAGVCLCDIRNQQQKNIDDAKGHSVIVGDLLGDRKELFVKIKEVLGKDKVDLIISRLMGGNIGIPNTDMVLHSIIQGWYKLLDSNGIILAQLDATYGSRKEQEQNDRIVEWIDKIKAVTDNKIDVGFKDRLIRLHKLPGAPEKLPRVVAFKL